MRYLVLLAVAASLSLAVVALASASNDGLVVVFEGPVDNGWRVRVSLGAVECSGVVGVNLAYRESRSVSEELLVAPLYYVLVSACGGGRVASWLQGLGEDNVSVVFEAPEGYVVRSGLDWRGFGPPGGPYRLPGLLLRRFYLYDGVVVASLGGYRVVDMEARGFTLVYPRGGPWGEAARLVAEAAVAVRGVVSGLLGESPRSPVAGVVAAPGEFRFMLPGVGYSLGGVFLVVPEPGAEPGWYVHVAAHEAVHGWLNDGLFYGDFSLAEAATEWLAVLGLWRGNRSLYMLAEPYIGGLVDFGEPYSVWMKVNALLWLAGLRVCGRDVYSEALAALFRGSLSSGATRLYSLVDVAAWINETCGPGVLEEWARLLPSAAEANVTELLASVEQEEAAGPGSGGGVSSAASAARPEEAQPRPPPRLPPRPPGDAWGWWGRDAAAGRAPGAGASAALLLAVAAAAAAAALLVRALKRVP